MAYYLLWPPNAGTPSNNKATLQISGISGFLSSIEYRVKTDSTAPAQRYIFDIRRQVDTTATGSGSGWLIQSVGGSTTVAGISGYQKNGVSTPVSGVFFNNYVADDVFKFNVNSAPSGGCIAFGARHNEVEHNYGFSVSEITIVDGAGTHLIDMTSSGGTLSEFQSIDGALTAKLFNFPTDGSQWVEYTPAPAAQPQNIAWTLESSGACMTWDSVQNATEYDIEFRERI